MASIQSHQEKGCVCERTSRKITYAFSDKIIRVKIIYDRMHIRLTKNDAKCSDVITALNPTTGTRAANNVPKTTCMKKVVSEDNEKSPKDCSANNIMSFIICFRSKVLKKFLYSVRKINK